MGTVIQTNAQNYLIFWKNMVLQKQLCFFNKRTVLKRLETYRQVSGVVEKVESIFHMEDQIV